MNDNFTDNTIGKALKQLLAETDSYVLCFNSLEEENSFVFSKGNVFEVAALTQMLQAHTCEYIKKATENSCLPEDESTLELIVDNTKEEK